MDKPVCDFIIVVGDSRANDSLSTFRLHRSVDDPKTIHGRTLFSLNAVDVNVRRSGAWIFFKKLLGQRTIANGLDLDLKRTASFSSNLVKSIKLGRPSVSLAFPDDLNDLPQSFKDDDLFFNIWKLYYSARNSMIARQQILEDAGIQKTEQQDIIAQSISKFNQFVTSTVSQFNAEEDKRIKDRVQGDDSPAPKKEYY